MKALSLIFAVVLTTRPSVAFTSCDLFEIGLFDVRLDEEESSFLLGVLELDVLVICSLVDLSSTSLGETLAIRFHLPLIEQF